MSNYSNIHNITTTNSTSSANYDADVEIWWKIMISLIVLFVSIFSLLMLFIKKQACIEFIYIRIIHRIHPIMVHIYPLPTISSRTNIVAPLPPLKEPDGVIIVQPDSNIAFGANIH
jgi:hypothetical protein